MTVPSLKLPKLMGHRGAKAVAPENTLAGVRAAKAAGVDWVELDVLPTFDGQAVVSHDDLLTRCCADDRLISALPANALEGVNAAAGDWPGLDAEPVPTLEAMLAELERLDMGLYLELKTYEDTNLDHLVDSVMEAFAYNTFMLRGYFWASFNERVLEIAQSDAPAVRRALITETFDESRIDTALNLGCFSIHVYEQVLDPAHVQRAKDQGLQVGSWTINTAERAKEAWDMGVDCVITDDPALLLAGCDAGHADDL